MEIFWSSGVGLQTKHTSEHRSVTHTSGGSYFVWQQWALLHFHLTPSRNATSLFHAMPLHIGNEEFRIKWFVTGINIKCVSPVFNQAPNILSWNLIPLISIYLLFSSQHKITLKPVVGKKSKLLCNLFDSETKYI